VSELVIEGVSSIGNVIAFDVPPHGVTTVIEAVPGLAMRAADTVAVSCVEETNVVVSAAPFQFTIEVEMKFVPLTVNVNCGSPHAAQIGLSELMVGTAAIVSVTAPDVDAHPPTVIEAVPGVAMSEAGTVAVSCFELTNVVARGLPFQYTVSPWMKSLLGPFTVNVKSGPPAAMQVGLIELIVGVVPIVITKVAVALLQELAPLVAVMVTLVVPVPAGVPEITPVLELTLRPAGNGLAVKLVGLLVAVIVWEKAIPFVPHAVSGLVITGALAIVKVCALDVPPHGVTTVIEAVPAVAIRAAGTVAVSCVPLTNVVASGLPFQFTVEPETKLAPLTVSVNCGLPAAVQFGLSELIVGAALIVIASVALAVLQEPPPLLAVMVTLVVAAVVGVPEITPVLVFTLRPAGSGLAVKLVGLLVAVIV